MISTPLRIVRVLAASADEVFDAWLDPEGLAVWMAPARSSDRSSRSMHASVAVSGS